MEAERKRVHLLVDAKAVYYRIKLLISQNCPDCSKEIPHLCKILADSVEFSIVLDQALEELKDETAISPDFSWYSFYEFYEYFYPNSFCQLTQD